MRSALARRAPQAPAHEREPASATAPTAGLLPSGGLARLPVGRSGDAYEREADRVAGRLGRGEPAGPVTALTAPRIQALGSPGESSVDASRLSALAGGGAPLPAHQQGFYARALGPAAASATLHRGAAADAVTASLGVDGLSVSGQVAVRSDAYDETRPDGGATLRHEMVHAAQHAAAGPDAAPLVQMGKGVKNKRDGSEDEEEEEDEEDVEDYEAERLRQAKLENRSVQKRRKQEPPPSPSSLTPPQNSSSSSSSSSSMVDDSAPSPPKKHRPKPFRRSRSAPVEREPRPRPSSEFLPSPSLDVELGFSSSTRGRTVAPPPTNYGTAQTDDRAFTQGTTPLTRSSLGSVMRVEGLYTRKLKAHEGNLTAFVDDIVRATNLSTFVPGFGTAGALLVAMRKAARQMDVLTWTSEHQLSATASLGVRTALAPAEVDLDATYGGLVHAASDFLHRGLALLKDANAMVAESARPVFPIFGPVTSQGMGTFASIDVTKGDRLPRGSKASGTVTSSPWEAKLGHRRWGRGASHFYIRGHLLNDHAGGPSAPVNLTPLVGVRNNEGAYTNLLHEALVESQLKKALAALDESNTTDSPQAVTRVIYHAQAGGRRSPRSHRERSIDPAAGRLDGMIWRLNAALKPKTRIGPGTKIGTFYKAVELGVAKRSALLPYWRRLAPAVGSMTGFDLDTDTLADLRDALRANAKLWAYEDEHVPRTLKVLLRVDRRGGEDGPDIGEPLRLDIDNVLPDAPWLMRYRKTAEAIRAPAEDEEESEDGEEEELSSSSTPSSSSSLSSSVSAPPSPALTRGQLYLHKTSKHAGNYKDFLDTWRIHAGQDATSETTALATRLDALDFTARAEDAQDPDAATLTHEDFAGWEDAPLSLLRDTGMAAENGVYKPMRDYARALQGLYARTDRQGARPALPMFGPPTAQGVGKSAFLLVTPKNSLPRGSSAEGTVNDLPWYKILKHRGWRLGRDRGSGRKPVGFFYIRGHLLNDHLGGPSTAYNLVPLAGAASIGTAKVNTEHEVAIESVAKSAIEEMDHQTQNSGDPFLDAPIEYVSYAVRVSAPGQPVRKGTAKAKTAADLFHEKVAPAFTSTAKISVSGSKARVTTEEWATLETAMAQVGAPSKFTYAQMQACLNANANLWKYEDANVPAAIQLALIVKRQGEDAKRLPYTLNNKLPDDSRNMMYRPKVTA